MLTFNEWGKTMLVGQPTKLQRNIKLETNNRERLMITLRLRLFRSTTFAFAEVVFLLSSPFSRCTRREFDWLQQALVTGCILRVVYGVCFERNTPIHLLGVVYSGVQEEVRSTECSAHSKNSEYSTCLHRSTSTGPAS